MVLAIAGCSKSPKSQQNGAVAETVSDSVSGSAYESLQYRNGLPTVIDFYATWCGPCKAIAPVFDVLKGEYGEKINFVSVDVDADNETARRYGIEAMPTFVILDSEGKEIRRIVGADAEALSAAVDNLASNS
jgi:thioredoxin